MNNKIHYDLLNVHAAPLTAGDDGAPAFDTPIRLAGAMSMDLSAEGDEIKVRADGIDYYVTYSNNGYSGDVNFVQVPNEFREKLLSEKLGTTSKVLTENAGAEQKPFALLFEFKGDKKNRRHVLYNVIASRPSIAGENKDTVKEPDTESLSITCSPLEDGNVKSSTTEETPEEIYNDWFKSVWLPSEESAANANESGD